LIVSFSEYEFALSTCLFIGSLIFYLDDSFMDRILEIMLQRNLNSIKRYPIFLRNNDEISK